MKNKVTLLNMVSGLVLQFITAISGFILPKIILMYFGSEANGLVSSLTQFLSYINLVEGGVTGVIAANLYKPLVERNISKVSAILVTSNKFYRKIGTVYIAYTVVLATSYPLIFHTEFSFSYIFALTLILSLGLLIQYIFSISLKTLLNTDKKTYIVNFTQSVIVILNLVLSVISIHVYPSIHIFKLINGILFVLQPLVFGAYIKKNYSINWKAKSNNELIKERWDGFTVNLAAFIHGSTDVTVLTIFTNLKIVSVYNVYSLVLMSVNQLINAIIAGITATVGHAYARRDFKELNQKLDIYEYVVFILVFFIFTVTALLITPFVQIYTHGVKDANYYQPTFGLFFVIAESIYMVKMPHLNLAYAANRFKEITLPAFIEAGLNIVLSIIFVREYGLVGVAIGTSIAMTYRMAFHVYYTSKIVPGRVQSIFYKKLLIFTGTSIVGYLLCSVVLPLTKLSVVNWILYALYYSIIVGILLGLVSLVFFKEELSFFRKYLKN
ncbi:polysaccharide biosynthesis C-terminal domain-containing protein [Limosilactobacillus fermentum]